MLVLPILLLSVCLLILLVLARLLFLRRERSLPTKRGGVDDRMRAVAQKKRVFSVASCRALQQMHTAPVALHATDCATFGSGQFSCAASAATSGAARTESVVEHKLTHFLNFNYSFSYTAPTSVVGRIRFRISELCEHCSTRSM